MREGHARVSSLLFLILFLILAAAPAANAQVSVGPSRPQITQPVSERNLVVLSGNTRPEAKNSANDRGIVPDSMSLSHMMVQLRRPAAQEQALAALIEQLHDPKSPNFHHWLTAAEVGAQFGPAASDIATVTAWLAQGGFTVNAVLANRMVIDVTGTAGQVGAAFHTEIHNIDVDGVARYANMSDPQIPAALAPAVVGVAALNNVPPKPMMQPASIQYTPNGYVCGPGHAFQCYLVTPPDLATIYNFNPIFSGGNTGQNQTIYLIETTDLYNTTDWTTFRTTFGIPVSSYPTASLTTVNPGSCTHDVGGADGEAILDAEYASAAAPGAAIVIASCESLLLAVENVINGPNPPAIMSISYGGCEAAEGASTNQAISTAYQTAVAGGMSIFVSSGDGGGDLCDNHNTSTYASSGLSANGYGSTVYNVSVGGTDFGDTYSGVNSTYWNSTNSGTYGSAKSYIPEIPWNNSCGSELYATHYGFSTTYGSSGLCNSSTASSNNLLNIAAGSGGPSSCASGSGASCQGWPKPSWQSGFLGNPADGVRDLPDVSLFAASGGWGHSYVFCYSDPSHNGKGCSGAPITWNLAGGTSFASPIWAGIQALVNQQAGAKQGLPNSRLYALAASEYGASGSSTCNASNGNAVGGSCIFYDVTLGDNDVDCMAASPNCYAPTGTYGVLSTSTSAYQPAYAATTGWDFASGIGTLNVANLVSNWVPISICPELTSTHDFNADCKSDILWRGTGASPTTVAMWLMNAGAIQSSGTVASISTSYSIIGQRDFNGDGDADLLWRDTSGNLYMWFMNGATMSSSANLGNVSPTTWTVMGTADMNGDGKGDILWQDAAGDLAIWFMNGSTVSSSAPLGTVAPSSGWSIAGTTTASILWMNTLASPYTYAVWKVNGTTVTSSTLGSVPSNWVVQGVGDFNGDTVPDILWRDSTSGTVAIWFLNNSGQVQSSGTVGAVSTGTTWAINQTGDYDGNGMSDILWVDGSGNVAIWFMNGATIASSVSLGNVGTTWAVQAQNAE